MDQLEQLMHMSNAQSGGYYAAFSGILLSVNGSFESTSNSSTLE